MDNHSSWFHPPAELILPEDEVHVWRASLNLPGWKVQILKQILDAEELRQAGRFWFERDRIHYIVARGLLKSILSRYLSIEPGQLRVDYNDYGKPILRSKPGQVDIKFNLSHSGTLALFAVTYNREVGIDLEQLRSDFDYRQVAENYFSANEKDKLRSFPDAVGYHAFFNCWTRKEAYIKGKGKGLSIPLADFDVSIAPGEPARLLCTKGEPDEALNWRLQEFTLDPGYIAALAVRGHGWQLKLWQWLD